MTNEITITAHAGYIHAAMAAVSKEETRYYLKGVFLDGRGFIAATNGHIAFAARCNDAFALRDVRPAFDTAGQSNAGVIVPDSAIAQTIKAAGRTKDEIMTFHRDAQGQWWILYGNARVAFQPVDGSFPDWTRIIPTAPDALVAAHYQPQYIVALGKMAQALRDGKKDAACAFRLHQNGENPALVTFPHSDSTAPRTDCCAVLMPMRAKGDLAGATFTDTFLNQ